jgi:hypothetical protein
VDDEDTWVGPAPTPDIDRGLREVMLADTDEWEHTDREIEAQGTIDTDPQMFDDTGVVIINRPEEMTKSDHFVVTFRQPPAVAFRKPPPRAATADEWPPSPRGPAPAGRERALKITSGYTFAARADTNKN